ncbi:hypothetical protein I6N95_25815 [Vagococcus sp. BWB3-3]|uniref:N-acetyltransferase domain-containing protein n=1 Tax=Vagococcus allomyrinae TaxID=2794353 RepID=A0A940SXS3_9ENTE|nr:hypothetical protein [Vagococcus allomyrinae]MBP1044429.1 hypothetical protein [Vagococcus allomyrinae]
MYRVIEFNQEEQYLNDFLSLPAKIYASQWLVQNPTEERQLLTNRHILSHYFKLRKFLVYNQAQEVCGRCVITMYPEDQQAYLGFFECIEAFDCCQLLLDHVASECLKMGFKAVVGPVDCSFWIRYRLKISDFDRQPYISEPYHPSYYLDFWERAQFHVTERYVSNQYPTVPKRDRPKDYQRATGRLVNQGYQLVSPKKSDWEKVIAEIYELISELYADFPIFKQLTLIDFKEYFANYAHILDFSMVKMIYKEGEAVAFFIGMPDYGNLLYQPLNAIRLLQMLIKKKRSKDYVLLYMGVKKGHRGVGIGLIQDVMSELSRRQGKAIGAFIHAGKVTERYWQQEIERQYHYALLARVLTDEE